MNCRVKKKHIKKFRKALLTFADEIFHRRIDVGRFDKDINAFLNGDTLEITLNIQLIPHDIIIFREMLGIKMNDEIRQKLFSLEEVK